MKGGIDLMYDLPNSWHSIVCFINNISKFRRVKYVVTLNKIRTEYYCQILKNMMLCTGAYSGGLWGLSPPGPVKSVDFWGVLDPKGCWAPIWKDKKISPPLDKFLNMPLVMYIVKITEICLSLIWIILFILLIMMVEKKLTGRTSKKFFFIPSS